MKTCWTCHWLLFEQGCPGYSEFTPGECPRVECMKDHPIFDFYDYDVKQQGVKIAEQCPDYRAEKGS